MIPSRRFAGLPHPRRHRGTALLELALVMPVLALLLLGVFDVGRSFAEQAAVTNAARQGARVAAIQAQGQGQPIPPALDDAAVRQAVLNELNGTVTIPNAATAIVITPSPRPVSPCTEAGSHLVTVTVTYQHDLLFGLLSQQGLSFSVSAAMPYCY